MCDKKNKVLFTDSQCLVLSPDFKLPDENQILLKVPRQNNMYSFNLENIVPLGGFACSREDLDAVYQLVMDKYQDEMPEGFDRVLWGDLMVLFKPDEMSFGTHSINGM
ncbi:hypothetical protein Tco_0310708 [Tanacetum coccineum]